MTWSNPLSSTVHDESSKQQTNKQIVYQFRCIFILSYLICTHFYHIQFFFSSGLHMFILMTQNGATLNALTKTVSMLFPVYINEELHISRSVFGWGCGLRSISVVILIRLDNGFDVKTLSEVWRPSKALSLDVHLCCFFPCCSWLKRWKSRGWRTRRTLRSRWRKPTGRRAERRAGVCFWNTSATLHGFRRRLFHWFPWPFCFCSLLGLPFETVSIDPVWCSVMQQMVLYPSHSYQSSQRFHLGCIFLSLYGFTHTVSISRPWRQL